MPPALEALKDTYPDAETFKFGDNSELSARLITLVRQGKKTATCGSLQEYRDEGEPLPAVGRCDIVLDWYGEPALVIRTTEVTIRKFCDVPEDFALAEGENETREGWARDHQGFFERTCGFDPYMELICERFEVVEDFGRV